MRMNTTNTHTASVFSITTMGAVWSNLHTERHDLCAALLAQPLKKDVTTRQGSERLHTRLAQVDTALDRLFDKK
jgi:hypothetical protein